ncbi:chitin deacetylase [Podila horticola]|nr:chitin deacetylase [Podila horticola]
MTKLEKAFEDVLGVVPRYMRPPYGDGTFGNGNADDQKVQGTLKNLGYVITTWDIATGDADIDDNTNPHKLTDDALMKSEQNQYTSIVNAAAKGATHMALHHDTYERTIVPVAVCLGDEDPRTWYKKIGPAAATTPAVCQK